MNQDHHLISLHVVFDPPLVGGFFGSLDQVRPKIDTETRHGKQGQNYTR